MRNANSLCSTIGATTRFGEPMLLKNLYASDSDSDSDLHSNELIYLLVRLCKNKEQWLLTIIIFGLQNTIVLLFSLGHVDIKLFADWTVIEYSISSSFCSSRFYYYLLFSVNYTIWEWAVQKAKRREPTEWLLAQRKVIYWEDYVQIVIYIFWVGGFDNLSKAQKDINRNKFLLFLHDLVVICDVMITYMYNLICRVLR